MKNLALYILMFGVSSGLFAKTIAQTYTVEINVNDVWWESQENFGAELSAVIYENGIPIPPSSDYYYTWYVYFSYEGHWRELTSGLGEDQVIPETLPGYSINNYVVVSDVVNHTFTNIQSGYTGLLVIPGTNPGDKGEALCFTYMIKTEGRSIRPLLQITGVIRSTRSNGEMDIIQLLPVATIR